MRVVHLPTVISFHVPGVPAPQGSKTPFGNEANPRTRPWRAAVSAEGSIVMAGCAPLTGPVCVEIIFSFPRPKSHYRTGKYAHILRETAPNFHTSTPDLDKLIRAIGDSLTGVVIRDDKQIASCRVTKQYAPAAGALIRITPLDTREEEEIDSNASSHRTDQASGGRVPRAVRA